MKKVVVVVGQEHHRLGDAVNVVEFKHEEFEGKNLKVINRDSYVVGVAETLPQLELLIVKDGNEELGVFRDWMYWKKIE